MGTQSDIRYKNANGTIQGRASVRETRRGSGQNPQEARRSNSGNSEPSMPNLTCMMTKVICEKAEGSDIPEIDRKKYLVPQELTVGQFVYLVRKRLRLPPEKAIFIFVNGVLPSTGAALMSQMYKDYKDPDGFLYVTYSGENVFG